MEEIFRSFEASIDSVLDGERAVVARINSSAVDRLRTVIDPLGADVTHFNKTRSVLWQHGQDPIRGTVPIGHGWAKVRRSEGDILGKTTFAKDAFSDQIFEGYKNESIRGWSIKAGIHDASPPTKAEIRSRPELESCDLIYRKWDLIELSATPTPGNSDCLVLLVSRGLITPPEGFVMPEPAEVPIPPVVASHTERWINQDGALWHVMETTGQRIASFATEADAQELLRAMADSRSFEQILMNVHTTQRAQFEQQKDELLAEIQLRLWGVV